MLAWHLHQAGKSLLVIDDATTISPSRITSGIINPVTGRRLVKTWLADELLPYAEKTYRELETTLNKKFYEPLRIVRLFDSVKAQNDWSVRAAVADYSPYLTNTSVIYLAEEKVNNPFGGFEINGAARLNTAVFLSAFRTFLKSNQQLVEDKFNYAELEVTDEYVSYKGAQAQHLIFCEGTLALQNPYFKNLPFQPAKGECLLVEIKDFPYHFMIKGNVTILPFYEKDVYYVGATHHPHFNHALPSENGKEELLQGLKHLLACPYKILDHWAALRPAVNGRRPLIGTHEQHKNVSIFNGMGTKGISLAPYFAHHFTQHLLHASPLLPEVDIKRFL
jgi:glycine/D-amino acid oxidase-like deaminating enzyme